MLLGTVFPSILQESFFSVPPSVPAEDVGPPRFLGNLSTCIFGTVKGTKELYSDAMTRSDKRTAQPLRCLILLRDATCLDRRSQSLGHPHRV